MADTQNQRLFELRWQRSERDLVASLQRLYGENPAFVARLKALLQARWTERPAALKDLDLARDIEPGLVPVAKRCRAMSSMSTASRKT